MLIKLRCGNNAAAALNRSIASGSLIRPVTICASRVVSSLIRCALICVSFAISSAIGVCSVFIVLVFRCVRFMSDD